MHSTYCTDRSAGGVHVRRAGLLAQSDGEDGRVQLRRGAAGAGHRPEPDRPAVRRGQGHRVLAVQQARLGEPRRRAGPAGGRGGQGEGRHAQGAQDRRALHRQAAGGAADHEGRGEDAHRRRRGALQPAWTAAGKGLQQQELLLNFWSRLCLLPPTDASASSLNSWCHLRCVIGQFIGSCTCRYFVQ